MKKTKEYLNNLPLTIKYFAAAITFMITLCGGIYAMEDRYVDQTEIAQSLDMFNLKMKTDIDKLSLQIQQDRLENVTTEYYRLKQLIRLYPDDSELKDEFEQVKERRLEIKRKIDQQMNIRVYK